jgi:hypothetical protein
MSDRLFDMEYPDTFVCELSRIDKLGNNRRLIFTVPSMEDGGYKNVVAKLIMPADLIVYMLAGDGARSEVASSLLSETKPVGRA